MQTGISRKIGLTVLIILTVLLLILSVLIAIRLQSDQATPDDSAAGDCDPATYAAQCQIISGARTGFVCKCVGAAASNCGGDTPCYVINCSEFDDNQCPGAVTTSTPGGSCTPGTIQTGACGGSGCAANQRPIATCNSAGTAYENQQCSTDNNCLDTSTTTTTTTTTGTGVQSCGTGTWQYTDDCIQVLSGTCNIHRFSGPNDPSAGLACPTTNTDDGTQTAGPGTYCPIPASGRCQQVDVQGSGQGVCSCSNVSTTTTTSSSSTTTTTVSTTTTTVSTTTTPPAEELPDTAIISDSADRVLFGVTLLMIGALAIKFDLVDKAMFVAGVQGTNAKQALNFEIKRRKSSREKFEGKFRTEN